MRYLLLLFTILLYACPSANNSSKETALPSILPSSSSQFVLVTTEDENATTGQMQLFEKHEKGAWKANGIPHPVNVGRTGLAWGNGLLKARSGQQKEEGDGKAPAGIFRLTKIFGYEPPLDVGFKMPFIRSNEILECVDDSNSKFYNQLVDSLNVEKDWTSSEFMRRDDELYKWGVLVEHNAEQKPKGGSCIFLHIWKGPDKPTAGCTAMSETNLMKILHWLDEKKSPVMIQLTSSEVADYQSKGQLPNL